MHKPRALRPGDRVAAVSLSSGLAGEGAVIERFSLAQRRLSEHFSLELCPMPNALRGIEYLDRHPQARAEDWMAAVADPDIAGIFCTIGGEDSIRLLPHVDFGLLAANPKVFLGYSDTTVSHFMLYKAGVTSYYGPCLLMEFAENVAMHAYTSEHVVRALMDSVSPIVDCGVHYVDVMCQLTGARPVRVHGIGAKLWEEAAQPNYGHLHVTFDDGSVGWYEAGWGPMMSEVAHFVKDVVGPHGSVSIVDHEAGERSSGSADIGGHTKTSSLRVHRAARDADGDFVHPDEWLDMSDEPDHDALCRREQELLLAAIDEDLDLDQHLDDAVESLRIVLAADESLRSGRVVEL